MDKSKGIVTFNLQGAKEIDKILNGLPVTVQAKILSKINREGAKIVQDEMKDSAPVGNDIIYSNIKIKKDKENLSGILVGVASKGFVARFIEYGTKQRKTKKGYDRGKMTPEPFIKRAIDSKINQVISHITENYGELIDKYLKRETKAVNRKIAKMK